MSILIGIFFFILGTVIGSFLNVVILRYNTGMGVDGRSQCFSCGKELRWFELIPVLSFVALRGKCARCKSKISWQYPLVELLTGLTFIALFLKYKALVWLSFGSFLIVMIYTLIIFSLLIVIFVYDLRHKIIPDGLVYSAAVLAFVRLFFAIPGVWHHGTWLDFLAGPIVAAPFAFLWLISQGTWMGFGDAKLGLVIGWMLGVMYGFSAVILAVWIGAGISLIIMAVQKSRLRVSTEELTMKSEIPFAPFLIVGLALVFFLGINVFSFSFALGAII